MYKNEVSMSFTIYWRNMPMAVYTFLESFNREGKILRPFCTHDGSGLSDTVRELKRICKGAEVKKGLAILGSDVDKAESVIRKWV